MERRRPAPIPVWRCPQLLPAPAGGISFTPAQLSTALKASQLLDMGLNYSPPRCSFRDFVRFVQVLRYVREQKLEDPELTDIPVGCISLPQPAILANLQWSIMKNVPDCSDYTDRIFFALSTPSASDQQQGPPAAATRHVKQKEFRQFITAVIRKVGSGALVESDAQLDRLFRVAGDEHVVDAIAEYEWGKLKASAGSGALPGRAAVAQRLMEFALLLCSSTTSFAPHIPLLVLEVLDGLFLPVALQVSSRPEIVQRLQQSRGSISLLPTAAAASSAPVVSGAVVMISAESGTVATSTVREKTRDMFPKRRPVQPNPLPPSPRQVVVPATTTSTAAALDGTRDGLNGEAAVEELHTFLQQFVAQPNDDEQKRMDKQFLHREARKLLDTYPTQFKTITMTL